MDSQFQDKLEVSVVDAQARAEFDIQVATAKRYPRNLTKVHEGALAAVTYSKEVAESCMYSVPKAGQRITGPSVRLAEIMVTNWGNFRAKWDLLEINHDYVLVQGMAFDLETNVAMSVNVRRRIVDKNGKRYGEDVIETTVAAAGAIAYRNAVFKIIPLAFVQPIYDAARELAVGAETEFDKQRQKFVKHFQALGIPTPTLLQHLGKAKVTDIRRDDIEYLIGVLNAIKDDNTKLDDIFTVTRDGKPMDDKAQSEDVPTKPAKAKEKEKEKAAPKDAAPDPEPEFGDGQSEIGEDF